MTDVVSLDGLHAQAVSALRQAKVSPPNDVVPLRRQVAAAFVEAREFFQTPDGEVDWAGRSHDFRSFVEKVYDDAGVAAIDRGRVAAAIRYHAGNILRERLDPRELARIGLSPDGPRERLRQRRARQAEALRTISGGHIAGTQQISRALTMASSLVEHVDLEEIESIDEESAGASEVLAGIEALYEQASRLRDVAGLS